MTDLLALLAHLMTNLATLLGPGGAKAVVAESLLLKHPLLIISRARRRAPNLCAMQRPVLGFWSLFPVLTGINISIVIYLVCNIGADTRSTNNPHTNDISVLVTFDESSLSFQTHRAISPVTTGHLAEHFHQFERFQPLVAIYQH